jgi:phosphate transport system ATP-binding protein
MATDVRSAPAGLVSDPDGEVSLTVEDLDVYYGSTIAVEGVSMKIPKQAITAIIGPSGCGKSTVLRALNRMHEVAPGARVTGKVVLDGEDIYGHGVDPVQVRRRIGMLFQRPNPFPTMSIYDNVVSGLKLNGRRPKDELDGIVEHSLQEVGLWEEVKGTLGKSAADLSGGQQQRLCLARCIAVTPEILLMDEPCSALDPIATLRIEELMRELKSQYTIVIVTHNMQQAGRVADRTAFFMLNEKRHGSLVEYGPTEQIFTAPRDKRTEEYVTGRFG